MISVNNVLIILSSIGLFMLLIYLLVVSCDSVDVNEGYVVIFIKITFDVDVDSVKSL